MAFDYGSIDLGLKNPFKLEGKITALRGTIQTLTALYLLYSASLLVKQDSVSGWILMIFGIVILVFGIRALAQGIYATLRYFVGRNHPTSLAYNHASSEASNADLEKDYLAYNKQELEEMLVGRKNSTFVEPEGFLARLFHSFFPKVLFLPYPIRNLAQRVFTAWVNSIVAILAYGVVAFLSLAGFVGAGGEIVFPVYTLLLMVYVLSIWRKAGKDISRQAQRKIEMLRVGGLFKVLAIAFALPLGAGIGLSWVMEQGMFTQTKILDIVALLPELNSAYYLIGTFAFALVSSVLIGVMLKARLAAIDPKVEVSELRENWQESVHPEEIFINLDNLVMANRRYKEVPNRVYRELGARPKEQFAGKGEFQGAMLQEVQPKFRPLELGKSFTTARAIALFGGNLLYLVAMIFTVMMAYAVIDIVGFARQVGWQQAFEPQNLSVMSGFILAATNIVLMAFLIRGFARLYLTASHLFFAEMQFESLLVYFKCEGTFTESKISTGTGIHDSTRSENTLVRSSITPWVIVSRLVTTTFAASGIRNLEYPRYVMEMHKAEQELADIKQDVMSFLKDRESIAAITSERDLGNASQVFQLNQQTRAQQMQPLTSNDEAAAGYLRQEQENQDKPEQIPTP